MKKIKRPSYSTVATWVKESWDEVSEDLIQRSFKTCGILTNIDSSEDDCIFDDVLDDRDDEMVEISDDENHEEYPKEANYENKWDIEADREDNDENESEEEKDDGNYSYEDSDDNDEEMRYRLKELKKMYKVKNLYYFILIY